MNYTVCHQSKSFPLHSGKLFLIRNKALSMVLLLGLLFTQSCKTVSEYPEYLSRKNALETTNKEFSFKAPGEGRGTFFIDEAIPEKNNVMFKWSPKTTYAMLLIKCGDIVIDEIEVTKTDHIKLNLTKYSSHKSLEWFLTVNESEDVLTGIIDLRKIKPPISYILSKKLKSH